MATISCRVLIIRLEQKTQLFVPPGLEMLYVKFGKSLLHGFKGDV